MKDEKEVFYVTKYTKGNSGNLVRECRLRDIKLSHLQNIFNIDPKNPDIIIRHMVDCYDIYEKEAKQLAPYMEFQFDLDKYDYQTGCRRDDSGKDYYIVKEFEKSIPWYFVEECKMDVSLDFLRDLFKNERYNSEPTDYGFAPYINLDPKYAIALQPYVSFKFELDKYDYWIEKRKENEPREVGQEGEEFIG